MAKEMKALQFDKPGAPLTLVNIAIPRPHKGQLHLTNGFGSSLPSVLGYDVCGTVAELGEGVTRLAVGDEVFGEPTFEGRCFAEYVVASAERLAKRKYISAKEAGCSTVVFGTAWFALFCNEDLSTFDIFGQKHKGKKIFVPGGGGGVGHMIVQLAKKSGYSVISSGSKPESMQMCKDCGAEHVIDYSKSDVIAEVMQITNGKGVDVAVDTTYQPSSFLSSASVVTKGGNWICVGTNWGDQHAPALRKCEERGVIAQVGDYGRYLRIPEFIALAPAHVNHMLAMCDRLYADGVRVHVTQVVDLADDAQLCEEIKAVGEGKRSGKVAVKIAGDN